MAKIINIEMATTSTGNPYKKATLDEQVLGKDRFNIFTFHTRYEDVQVGRAFDVSEFQQDGQYIKLVDPDQGIKRGGGNKRGFDAVAAVALRNDNITKNMDRKEDSFKVSATFRDATLMTVELMKQDPLLDHHVTWLKERQWLIENYEIL